MYKKIHQLFCFHKWKEDPKMHLDPSKKGIVYYSRCEKCGKVIAEVWKL